MNKRRREGDHTELTAHTTHGYGEFREALQRMRTRLSETGSEAIGAGRRVTVSDVEAALRRIQQGTYGICQSCFLVMPRGELLRQPSAVICEECRARRARQQRRPSGESPELQAA